MLTLVTHAPPITGFGRYAHGLTRALEAAGEPVRSVRLDAEESVVHVREDGKTTVLPMPPAPDRFLFYHRAWRHLDIQGDVHLTNQNLAWLPADHKIITVMDLYYDLGGPWLRRAVGRWFYRHIPGAAGIITPTQDVADAVRGHWPGMASTVTGIGIDPPVDRPRRPVPGRILHVGSEDPRKGIDLLLEALAIVRRTVPEAHLVRAGGALASHHQRNLRLARRLGVEDAVRWTGPVPQEELERIYARASVFAFPSRFEGFGLPPLEAMARRVPVVTGDVPVLRETLGDAALMCRLEPHDLADSLEALLTDPDQAARRAEAGARQVRLHDWDSVARRTQAAYGKAFGTASVASTERAASMPGSG